MSPSTGSEHDVRPGAAAAARPAADPCPRRRAASGWRSALAAWVLWPKHFFAPYLVGYLFWLGIALGSIGPDDAASPGRRLVGAGDPAAARGRGGDGAAARRCFSCRSPSGFRLSIPGLRADAADASAHITQGRLLERNVVPGSRRRLFRRLDRARVSAHWVVEPAGPYRATIGRAAGFKRLSGPGTVILFAAGTFSAVDWVMSLEAPWASIDLRRDGDHR